MTGIDDLRLDDRTALVVVDLQNDFAHPDGSLYVAGGEEVVPVVADLVRRALAAGATVVYTQDWHPPDTPHFADRGGRWPAHCVRGTWGAELHPALEVPEGTAIIRKGTNGEDGYSAFTMRDPATDENVPTMLVGIASPITSVARPLRRKSSRTATVKIVPMMMFHTTRSTAE